MGGGEQVFRGVPAGEHQLGVLRLGAQHRLQQGTVHRPAVVGGDDLKVGDPTVAGATVEASVVKEGRAKKVIVYKYKRKTGYHKKNGHRQAFTQVKIEKING